MLTGEDAGRTRRAGILPGVMERLRQIELSADTERRTLLNSAPTVLNSPVSPPRQNALSRRVLLESQSTRRRDLLEESSTFLGRHVAAREAAGSNSNELYRRFERRLETFRSLARQRLSEPVAESNHRTENDRSAHSLDVNVLRGAQLSASPTSIRGAVNFNSFRTRRPLRTDSRQPSTPSSGSQMADRLSLLSNLSVQNLSTPTAIARPLLFDEPSSYVSSPVEEDEPRSYSVRRRTNAQGDEVVHNITLDLEEDESTREQTAAMTRMRRPNYQRSNVPPVVIPSSDRMRRNRGELIVDSDGDEEEEDPEGPSSRRRSQVPGLLVPLTRSSFSPDDDSDELPRVRLSSRDFDYYVVADAAIDNIIECRRRTQPSVESFGSDTPFYVDPLPMPLEKMIPSKDVLSNDGVHVHSQLAILAGR